MLGEVLKGSATTINIDIVDHHDRYMQKPLSINIFSQLIL